MAENVDIQLEKIEDDEQKVTPWTAHAGKGKKTIDYDKLIRELHNNLSLRSSYPHLTRKR